MRKAASRQSLARRHVCLVGHLGPPRRSSDCQTEGRLGNPSLIAVEFTKENIAGLGKIPFLNRNTDFISGYGFLGDGLDGCVCGIITRVSLLLFFYGSTINRTFPALVGHLEKLFISPLGLGDYKRQTPFQL